MQALPVLQHQPINQTDREQTRWETCNRLLVKRMLDQMTLEVAIEVQTGHTQTAYEIANYLESMYATSRAEERMLLVKTMVNLTPQGNTTAMMRQWESITKIIEENGYTVQEICHDIGILLIGDWQRPYVRTRLEELFALSKEGVTHTINMRDFINNLQARANIAKPGPYTSLYYPIYTQDAHLGPLSGKSESKTNTFKGGTPSKPQSPTSLVQRYSQVDDCPHCHRGRHREDDCWTLHPEKRPKWPHYYQKKHSGAANLVKSTKLTDGWVFDTGASWITYNDRSAFKDFIPLNHEHTVDLPDGSTHQVEGIGNIDLSTRKGKIELKNVRFIPSVRARLLSFSQMEGQGFDIQLTNEHPRKFKIISPDDQISFYTSQSAKDDVFDQLTEDSTDEEEEEMKSED